MSASINPGSRVTSRRPQALRQSGPSSHGRVSCQTTARGLRGKRRGMPCGRGEFASVVTAMMWTSMSLPSTWRATDAASGTDSRRLNSQPARLRPAHVSATEWLNLRSVGANATLRRGCMAAACTGRISGHGLADTPARCKRRHRRVARPIQGGVAGFLAAAPPSVYTPARRGRCQRSRSHATPMSRGTAVRTRSSR
jgi:hypothetical protein